MPTKRHIQTHITNSNDNEEQGKKPASCDNFWCRWIFRLAFFGTPYPHTLFVVRCASIKCWHKSFELAHKLGAHCVCVMRMQRSWAPIVIRDLWASLCCDLIINRMKFRVRVYVIRLLQFTTNFNFNFIHFFIYRFILIPPFEFYQFMFLQSKIIL